MSVIENANLKFPRSRTPLKKVEKIIIHHPVANWTVERTHRYFIESKGWNGIAYNYYIQKNGRAFYGRSDEKQEYVGAHAGKVWNGKSLGVCFEGNFELERISESHFSLGVEVVTELCRKHKLKANDILPHSAVSKTVCPGSNFPMERLIIEVGKKLKHGGTSTQKLWRVQVGAFANQDNAKRLAEKLKKDGYDTYIMKY